jgi:hypothetical protein
MFCSRVSHVCRRILGAVTLCATACRSHSDTMHAAGLLGGPGTVRRCDHAARP